MTKTTCINLFGGPGCGKSTTAAEVFAKLKSRGKSVELVGEYVKKMAWDGQRVNPTNQISVLGKQASYENRLYGKVDYIVTDSPVLLAGFYATTMGKKCKYVSDAAVAYTRAHEDEVTYINIILNRTKKYDPRGRFQNEQEANDLDLTIRYYLFDNGFSMHTAESNYRSVLRHVERVKQEKLLSRLDRIRLFGSDLKSQLNPLFT